MTINALKKTLTTGLVAPFILSVGMAYSFNANAANDHSDSVLPQHAGWLSMLTMKAKKVADKYDREHFKPCPQHAQKKRQRKKTKIGRVKANPVRTAVQERREFEKKYKKASTTRGNTIHRELAKDPELQKYFETEASWYKGVPRAGIDGASVVDVVHRNKNGDVNFMADYKAGARGIGRKQYESFQKNIPGVPAYRVTFPKLDRAVYKKSSKFLECFEKIKRYTP